MAEILTDSWIRLMPTGNDSECMITYPSVDNPEDMPVRVDACSKNSRNALWRFEPRANSSGVYTIFNKAYTDYLQLTFKTAGPYKVTKMMQKAEHDWSRSWMISTVI